MLPLPEWAPNIHPLVVHFPIALLVTAVLTDFIALVVRRYGWVRLAAICLYTIGAVTAMAAFLTGQVGTKEVLVPAAANSVLTAHEDWAMWTVWFYSLFTLARIGIARLGLQTLTVHLPCFLVGAGGLFLLYETGDHGAQMVFQHGVGVQAVTKMGMKPHDYSQHGGEAEEGHEEGGPEGHREAEAAVPGSHASAVTGLMIEKDGAWRWDVKQDADLALREHFDWIEGTWADLSPAVRHDATEGNILALHSKGKPALFCAGTPLQSLQVDLRLNLDAFDGEAMIVHHVRDGRNYHFLSLGKERMRLGVVREGAREIQNESSIDATGWLPVRLVSQKTHFRGYIGDRLKVHAHGHESVAGRVGLLVNGTGTLLLSGFEAQVLR